MNILPNKPNSRLSLGRQGPLFGGGASSSNPPQPSGWGNGIFVAGNNAFGWGYAIEPVVSAPLGLIVDEPYSAAPLLAFWEAPDDSRVIVAFAGDIASELAGYTFNINGTKLGVVAPAVYDAGNNWTIMQLESHWMIDGEAYIVYRTPV